jgi:hypothetical protein
VPMRGTADDRARRDSSLRRCPAAYRAESDPIFAAGAGGVYGTGEVRCDINAPRSDNSPSVIEETRQYIRDFDRVASETRTARDLYFLR